jgi:hypothetical protein
MAQNPVSSAKKFTHPQGIKQWIRPKMLHHGLDKITEYDRCKAKKNVVWDNLSCFVYMTF